MSMTPEQAAAHEANQARAMFDPITNAHNTNAAMYRAQAHAQAEGQDAVEQTAKNYTEYYEKILKTEREKSDKYLESLGTLEKVLQVRTGELEAAKLKNDSLAIAMLELLDQQDIDAVMQRTDELMSDADFASLG